MGVTAQVIIVSLTHWTRLEGQAVGAGAVPSGPHGPCLVVGFFSFQPVVSPAEQEVTGGNPPQSKALCAPGWGGGGQRREVEGRRLPWCSGVSG